MPQNLPSFNRVVIVGVGLLGASLGLALKKHGIARRVVGVGRAGSPSLETALARGAVDETATDLVAAVWGADLVVLCSPVRQFPEALRQLAPALGPDAIVTDVGSTKSQVLQWAREILPGQVTFVGSHPMAGSEKKGPGAARDDLYEGAVCLVCAGGAGSQNSAVTARVAGMWRALGMRVIETDAATHDRWVAAISHLPHAVAASLVNAAAREPASLQAIAGGFVDATRIASSDVDMWTDIFLTNRAAVAGVLEEFEKRLGALRQAITAGDEPAIRAALTSAKQVRDSLADPRKRSCE